MTMSAPAAAPPAPAGTAHNLPRPRTQFIGREREIAECVRLLDDTRLLTLTGIGGGGKTRLALRVAEAALRATRTASGSSIWRRSAMPAASWKRSPACSACARARTGICGPRSGPRQRPPAAAGARQLRAPAGRGRRDVVDALLGPRPDCESSPPAAKVWGSTGERLFAVRSLRRPPPDAREPRAVAASHAVRLFMDRAQRIAPDFALTDEQRGGGRRDLPAARRHPAGARAGGRAREAAVGRADSRPAGRSVPAADRRRRRRCRAIRRCRRRFSGATTSSPPTSSGCSACCRCSPAAGRSRSPRGCSRTTPTSSRRSTCCRAWWTSRWCWSSAGAEATRATPCWRPCASTRPSGWCESGDAGAVRRRHAEEFLAIAERAYAERVTKEASWAELLDTEHDNLRAALALLRDSDPEQYLELAGALAWFWQARSHLLEGREHLTRALAASPASPPRTTRARALWGGAYLHACAATPRPRRR